MLILAYFLPKMNFIVKMTTPYSSPYCALSSCKILGKNNELFFHKVQKKLQKKVKGQKGGQKC